MTIEELSKALKAKNPNYANVDDLKLVTSAIRANPGLANKLDKPNIETIEGEKQKLFSSKQEFAKREETTQQTEETPGFFGRLSDRFSDFVGEAKEVDEKRGGALSQLNPRTQLRQAGVAGRLIGETGGDIFVQGIKGLSWLSEKISGTEGTAETIIPKALNTETGKSVIEMAQAGGELWDVAKKAFPELAQDVEDALAVGEAIPTGMMAKKTLSATGDVIKGTKELAEEAIKPRIIKASEEKINKLVGEIVQSKDKKTLERAKETLKNIDTSDIKTYEDFSNKIKDDISVLGRKQSELLNADERLFKINEFTKQVGNKEQNFINRALDQLEELYDKTQADEKLLALRQTRQRFVDEGVTLKDMNDLSIQYSKNMPSAFSKLGDPLTSVNKVASENTRKGLKDLLRKELPDDTSKLLDEQMSNLFGIQKSVNKMEESVQNLTNKVIKRGLAEGAGRKLGQLLQMVPGSGGVKGLINSFINSNIGNKSMNALALEKNLATALGKFDKLNKRIDRLSSDNAATAIYAILNDFKKNQAGFQKLPGGTAQLDNLNLEYKEAQKALDLIDRKGGTKAEIKTAESRVKSLEDRIRKEQNK